VLIDGEDSTGLIGRVGFAEAFRSPILHKGEIAKTCE
jgi:hypothetical protein